MQNGRFEAFENAKKHLCSVFSILEDDKISMDASLEELLEQSYGAINKKKAIKILEKQLGRTVIDQNIISERKEFSSHRAVQVMNKNYISKQPNTIRSLAKQGKLNMGNDEGISASMMCLGIDEKEKLFKKDNFSTNSYRRNSFENNRDLSNLATTQKFGENSGIPVEDTFQGEVDNSIIVPSNYNPQYTKTTKNISFEGELINI